MKAPRRQQQVPHIADASTAPRQVAAPPRRPVREWVVGAWPWLVPVTALAATAAWLAGVTSGQAHGPLRLGLIVAGAALTFAAAGLPLWQHRRAADARADAVAAAEAARIRMRVTLNDALEPLAHLIAQLGESPDAQKPQRQGEAIQFTVNTMAALTGTDRARVCFFRLDLGPPARFRLDAFAGRAGAPDATLHPGTDEGDAAMRALGGGRWLLLNDLSRRPAPFSWDLVPEYRTAVIGPVQRAGLPIGLLTLDALHPGELMNTELGVLRLLAELLGIALTT